MKKHGKSIITLAIAAALGLLTALPVLADGPGAAKPEPVLDGRYWVILEDGSLQSTIESWAEFAGWTVVWDSPVDYRFRASATFVGGFEESVGRLVDTIYQTNPELHVTLYTGNNTVHVQEKSATTN